MQFKFRTLFIVSLLAMSQTGFSSGQGSEELKKIKKYIEVLSKYFGYDVEAEGGRYCPGDDPASCSSLFKSGQLTEPKPQNGLLDKDMTNAAEYGLYSSYLGTLLGGTNAQPANPLVPGASSVINTWSGQVFPSYASPSNQTVSASSIIDQKTFQTDPVSQSILNMLSTSDYSYCVYTQNPGQPEPCNLLFREKVLTGVIGQLPITSDVFSPSYNMPMVSQLNSNVLLMPLLYSNTDTSNNQQQGQQSGKNTTAASASGLKATNQAQQAANFVRYASGMVNPIALPNQSTYDALVGKALNYSDIKNMTKAQQDEQLAAQITLADYLTKLRAYSAQTSVAVSNLYYILSRRLPQSGQQNPMKNFVDEFTPGGAANSASPAANALGSQQDSSAALNEFLMASWRLFDSNNAAGSQQDSSKQWLSKVNKGSVASVQKEIAVLLAEINYQLYLTRQQNERMLLTQSIMLLQASRSAMPSNQLTQTSLPNETGSSSNIP